LTIVVGLVLLGLSLYISTLVYAVRTYSRSRLSDRLRNGERQRWLDWLDQHEWELQTLTGLLRLLVNFVVLICVWAFFRSSLAWPADPWPEIQAGIATLLLLAIFAIAIPHALSVHAGEAVLAISLGPLAWIRWLLWPLGRLFAMVEFVVRRLLGKAEVSKEEETERVEQEILDAVSEGKAHGAVDDEQKDMIESVFELDETAVNAIMTPRTDIDGVPAGASYDQVREAILNSGHSRLPVYEDSVDRIVGVVYAKDLLRLDPNQPFELREIMRVAPYVPETKTLNELLREFRANKVQIAIVLDEYGGTAGLVTIEDILEELVGEIDDEYDQKPPPAMNRLDADTLEVDARVHIDEINEELEIELPEEEDYETIGGFVFATLGKIPAAGEEFRHENIRVEVVDAETRKIKRLRLHVLRHEAKSA